MLLLCYKQVLEYIMSGVVYLLLETTLLSFIGEVITNFTASQTPQLNIEPPFGTQEEESTPMRQRMA